MEEVSVSFLLSENHGLTDLHAIDVRYSFVILPFTCLGMFRQTVVINSSALKMDPRPTVTIPGELQVSSCSEFVDRYELDIIVNEAVGNQIYGKHICKKKNAFFNYIMFCMYHLDIGVSSEREPPSDTSHGLYLKLEPYAPLSIQLPWPFLVDDIQSTLRYQKTKENCPAKLILMESLYSPWPSEFENRARWNLDSSSSGVDWKMFGNFSTNLAIIQCQNCH